MRQSVAILSLLAGAACADDVLSFIFPGGFEGIPPVATIESVGPSTTSAVLTCPTGTPSDECGFASGMEIEIIGGTRYQASMSAAGMYVSYGCDGYNAAAQTMTCTAELSGEDTQTAVLSGSNVAFLTATIVEGAELLSAGASATTSAASASASASVSAALSRSSAIVSSGMQTSASASGTAAAGSQASGSASPTASPAPQSTGAAARFGIEGAALLALAGAAVVNAL